MKRVISDFMTVCDCCGAEIPQEEASDGIGEYEDGVLCSDCYAEVFFELQAEIERLRYGDTLSEGEAEGLRDVEAFYKEDDDD